MERFSGSLLEPSLVSHTDCPTMYHGCIVYPLVETTKVPSVFTNDVPAATLSCLPFNIELSDCLCPLRACRCRTGPDGRTRSQAQRGMLQLWSRRSVLEKNRQRYRSRGAETLSRASPAINTLVRVVTTSCS